MLVVVSCIAAFLFVILVFRGFTGGLIRTKAKAVQREENLNRWCEKELEALFQNTAMTFRQDVGPDGVAVVVIYSLVGDHIATISRSALLNDPHAFLDALTV